MKETDMLSINSMLAVESAPKNVSALQKQIQTKVLSDMMGEDSLPSQLLDLMKSSAQTLQQTQATAQAQMKSGYLDVRV